MGGQSTVCLSRFYVIMPNRAPAFSPPHRILGLSTIPKEHHLQAFSLSHHHPSKDNETVTECMCINYCYTLLGSLARSLARVFFLALLSFLSFLDLLLLGSLKQTQPWTRKSEVTKLESFSLHSSGSDERKSELFIHWASGF